jgi:hypothetical protein
MNKSFYPRLYNFINEGSTPPKIVVGRDSEVILFDKLNADRILKVGNKKATDKISIDELKNLKKFPKSNYRADLFNFLEQQGYNIDELLSGTEPNIDVTYNEFWKEQVQKHNVELKQYNEEKGGDEDRNFEVSEELKAFFNENNKGNEFQIFIDSIPGGEVKIPLNNLFTIMNKVITNKGGSISTKFMGQPFNFDKSLIESWKKDMLEYIHFLTDVNQLTNSDLYQSKILKDGTFLNALFIIKAAGLGRGEILLLYMTNDSRVSGGSESFDLKIGDIKYEVKEYVMGSDCSSVERCSKKAEAGVIRLGTGGKVTRFQFWKNIQETIRVAQEIYEKYGDSLQSITGDYLYETWLNLIDDELDHPKAVFGGVAGGEIGKERWNMLKLWYYLANEFTTKGISQTEDQFTMATLQGPDVKPDTILIEPVEKGELQVGDMIEVKSDEDITEMITLLKNLPYVKNPNQLDEDIKEMPIDYFEREGLDKFIVFRRKKIYIADGSQFSFAKISQAGVNIIESDLLKDKADVGKRGYDDWKNAIQKEIDDAKTKEEKIAISDIAKKFNLYDFVIQELEKDFEESQTRKIEQKKMSSKKSSERTKQKRLELKKQKELVTTESFYPRLFNKL